MNSKNTFEILIRKKIPYWSELLLALMVVFCLVLFLLYLIMIPSDKATGEMKAAYYILVVPEWLKTASFYSFIGLILSASFHLISKQHKPALLVIGEENIRISGKKKEKIVPAETVSKIMINDVRRFFRRNQTLEVVLKKGTSILASFILKRYDEADDLIAALTRYDNAEIVFYNEFAMGSHDENLEDLS